MDKLLGDIRPVGVRSVDEIDAKLRQAFECPDRLCPVKRRPLDAGPVMRIAPKPRRWTSMSPPILNEPDLRVSSFAIVLIPSALAQFGVGASGRAEMRSATRCWSRHKLRSWIPRASRCETVLWRYSAHEPKWPQASLRMSAVSSSVRLPT